MIPESLLANGSLDLLGVSQRGWLARAYVFARRGSNSTIIGDDELGHEPRHRKLCGAAHLSVQPARDFAALGRDLRRQGERNGRERRFHATVMDRELGRLRATLLTREQSILRGESDFSVPSSSSRRRKQSIRSVPFRASLTMRKSVTGPPWVSVAGRPSSPASSTPGNFKFRQRQRRHRVHRQRQR